MAQDIIPVASPAPRPSRRGSKMKTDAELSKSLADFLRGYTPQAQEPERDVLDDRYRIDLGSPLPEYNSLQADAYSASDSRAPKRALIALVCKPGTVQRTHAIGPLKNTPNPNVLALAAAGVVGLTRPEEERFVLFYDRPKGKKLSVLVASSKTQPSFDFMCSQIISPIAQAIQHFSELGFSHGCINPDNIYFDDIAVLGPCVAEPCGMAQPMYYEPLERIQATPSGKGEGNVSQDYYALAVVVLNIIYGANHFTGLSQEALVRSIMKEGAFNALSRQKDMPEVFYDFFRGLLSMNAHDRWSHKYLKAWLDGKRYNVMPPSPPIESLRPFEFGNLLANTRRELAHFFFQHWNEVPEVFENGELLQWVSISLRNKELSEFLVRMGRSMHSSTRKNDGALDEQIMRLIAVLDPTGPVRLKQLSFHIDGMNGLCAELVATQSQAQLQLFMRFIELSMFHFIIEQRNKNADERETALPSVGAATPQAIDNSIARLDRIRMITRNTGFGFGTERILYDLNPGMACLSPLLAGRHVATLPAMLKALDRLAPKLAESNDPIDTHIAAFIASKLNIQHKILLSELDANPTLASNPTMMALKLLAAAQQKSSMMSLPGLTHWLTSRLLPTLDVLRSQTLRQKVKNMMVTVCRTGSLPKMAELMIHSGYAPSEAAAFQQAAVRFEQSKQDIIYYRKGDMLEINSQQLGALLAHYGALAALAISFILALRGG